MLMDMLFVLILIFGMFTSGGCTCSLQGTDGAVHTFAIYKDLLIVGGTFTKTFQPNGGALRTGGLAAWRAASTGQAGAWELVGASLQGAVFTSLANSSRLYVGGKFNQFATQRFNGIAMYDGAGWSPLGAGVSGGNVLALAVLDHMLYVGGDFSWAGGKKLSAVAAWDVSMSNWRFFGKVDGKVHSLLNWDGHLLVGGKFETAGGVLALSIARYLPSSDGQQLGRWYSVGRGIDGKVNALVAAGHCLYAAGDLGQVSDWSGIRPATANLARYCPNGEDANSSAVWEPAVLQDSGERQGLATLYGLASAVPASVAHFDLRRTYFWECGVNSTNATQGMWKSTTNATQGMRNETNMTVTTNTTWDWVEGVNAFNGTCIRHEMPLAPLVFY